MLWSSVGCKMCKYCNNFFFLRRTKREHIEYRKVAGCPSNTAHDGLME